MGGQRVRYLATRSRASCSICLPGSPRLSMSATQSSYSRAYVAIHLSVSSALILTKVLPRPSAALRPTAVASSQ